MNFFKDLIDLSNLFKRFILDNLGLFQNYLSDLSTVKEILSGLFNWFFIIM